MKVSIITPVYNSSSYIRCYLDMVMSQTMKDIEVIIVDDKGKDNTISIAHTITDNYRGPIRFKYLSTLVNSGPGTGRNVGVTAAEGEYLAFVDSDDIIDPDFCRLLYDSAKKNDSDLCFCNLELYAEDGSFIQTRKNPTIKDGDFSGEERRKFLISYVTYFTTFLYKKSFFDEFSILFPPTRCSEDSAMFCCALLCCRRISSVDRSLYKYMRRSGSITQSCYPGRFNHKLQSMDMLMETAKLNGWYSHAKEELDFIYFKKGYLMSVFSYVSSNGSAGREWIKEIRTELIRQVPDYRQNRYYRANSMFRSLDFLVSSFPAIAVLVIKVYLKLFSNHHLI